MLTHRAPLMQRDGSRVGRVAPHPACAAGTFASAGASACTGTHAHGARGVTGTATPLTSPARHGGVRSRDAAVGLADPQRACHRRTASRTRPCAWPAPAAAAAPPTAPRARATPATARRAPAPPSPAPVRPRPNQAARTADAEGSPGLHALARLPSAATSLRRWVYQPERRRRLHRCALRTTPPALVWPAAHSPGLTSFGRARPRPTACSGGSYQAQPGQSSCTGTGGRVPRARHTRRRADVVRGAGPDAGTPPARTACTLGTASAAVAANSSSTCACAFGSHAGVPRRPLGSGH